MRSREGWWIAVATVIGAAVRIVYVANLEVSSYDPWRHLALIRNLREGAGFTLYDGQPYIFYHSLWYRLVAVFPDSLRGEWVAAAGGQERAQVLREGRPLLDDDVCVIAGDEVRERAALQRAELHQEAVGRDPLRRVGCDIAEGVDLYIEFRLGGHADADETDL